MEEIEIWPYEQVVYAQIESILENEMHKALWDFETQTDHLIPARRPELAIAKKKKKRKEEFSLPTDHCVKKIKEKRY